MLSFSVDGKPRSQKQKSVITNTSEPDTSKMALAGIGLIAYMARRRFQTL